MRHQLGLWWLVPLGDPNSVLGEVNLVGVSDRVKDQKVLFIGTSYGAQCI